MTKDEIRKYIITYFVMIYGAKPITKGVFMRGRDELSIALIGNNIGHGLYCKDDSDFINIEAGGSTITFTPKALDLLK